MAAALRRLSEEEPPLPSVASVVPSAPWRRGRRGMESLRPCPPRVLPPVPSGSQDDIPLGRQKRKKTKGKNSLGKRLI
ncbi:hypothetical protein JD844_023176 [Phrynosoma platyrhinos]|uniref:Uncharacterized protein n=1 Tax=Phrynosoma platyrhinos TaxID=52577 RepID=A0ABQ7SWJ1_PHRPL|nr:hypothetical protein JD844_023176 [Phrynosoma platyrhinos]